MSRVEVPERVRKMYGENVPGEWINRESPTKTEMGITGINNVTDEGRQAIIDSLCQVPRLGRQFSETLAA